MENVIIVPGTISLEDHIALGNYDGKDECITERSFPTTHVNGCWQSRLVDPTVDITSENAKLLGEQDVFQSANLEHLLSFGSIYPDEQKKHPIIALGSVCRIRGNNLVPVLMGDHSRRDLALAWWSGIWRTPCRFLVVRKIS